MSSYSAYSVWERTDVFFLFPGEACQEGGQEKSADQDEDDEGEGSLNHRPPLVRQHHLHQQPAFINISLFTISLYQPCFRRSSSNYRSNNNPAPPHPSIVPAARVYRAVSLTIWVSKFPRYLLQGKSSPSNHLWNAAQRSNHEDMFIWLQHLSTRTAILCCEVESSFYIVQ